MNPSLTSRFHALTGEIKALAAGSWVMFRQEMSGKAAHTRRQTIFMAAGALTALTAILLVLSGITLLLAQLLVSQVGWPPLVAGGVSALVVALLFALTGWLVFRSSAASLKAETLTPTQTLASLKSAAASLTNQPVIPQPPTTPMNSRQDFKNALNETAETVEYQARRAGRAVQETASSLNQKLDPGAFFAQVLSWVDAVLTPQNRALAGKAMTAAALLPRRHPTVAALLGLGGIYLAWKKSSETAAHRSMEEYAAEVRDSAAKGYKAAAAAGRDIRGSVYSATSQLADNSRDIAQQFGTTATQTAGRIREAYEEARHSVTDGVEHLSETAQQLRKDAEAGYRKAKEFAREEPALAIAGGVALAIGALLLVKSSRR